MDQQVALNSNDEYEVSQLVCAPGAGFVQTLRPRGTAAGAPPAPRTLCQDL